MVIILTYDPGSQDRNIPLPMISATLSHAERSIEVQMIVDTGAGISILPFETALSLAYDLRRLPKGKIGGFGGRLEVKKGLMDVSISGEDESHTLRCPVHILTKALPKLKTPVLGFYPVFDRFDITFRDRLRLIEFEYVGEQLAVEGGFK